jgi:hypothetical protein
MTSTYLIFSWFFPSVHYIFDKQQFFIQSAERLMGTGTAIQVFLPDGIGGAGS